MSTWLCASLSTDYLDAPPRTRCAWSVDVCNSFLQTALGEMMGSELPSSARENINDILATVACIIDADESGTITEDEFAASANLFVTIANGASPFDNPDIFFDLLGEMAATRSR